jgi:hypothetical protein
MPDVAVIRMGTLRHEGNSSLGGNTLLTMGSLRSRRAWAIGALHAGHFVPGFCAVIGSQCLLLGS